jgi:cellulose synthase/poly-beta-1,6-N-acetylglucosamine synthase-like glycosyltransferase
MLLYALIVAALILVWLAIVVYAGARLRRAGDAPPMTGPWPSVSVVVAAMNEEGTIEPAMRSLMELDYPALEVIAVDDRSADATGRILDRLAEENPGRLRALHITELPAGWLGKCNALRTASRTVRGEWILFTDADVIFSPEALRTALAFATAGRADHIVLFPRMLWEGWLEAALLSFFTMAFTIGFQMWRVESRSKRAFIGVGAFNMVRRDIYERFGGHEPLRLEVADDVKLGLLVKKHGGRSMAVDSGGQVIVRWREGVRDTMRGLERSGFAGLDFNWLKLSASVLFCLGVMLAPYALPFLSDSPAMLWLSLGSIAAIITIYALNGRRNGFPLWIGLLHPAACLLFAYAFIRSAVVTTARGGLSWRGTFYSIEELKRGTVRGGG